MAEISDFVVVDDNNVARFPEGMAFAQVNNSARADEGILARWFKDINGSLVTAGTATAYTLTPNRTVPALYVGLHFKLQFNVDCGANPTLTLPTLAAVNLVREGNTGLNALDVRAGPIYDVVYNGTGFQVTNIPLAPATLRRSENDATDRTALTFQRGSGAGANATIDAGSTGANDTNALSFKFGGTEVVRFGATVPAVFASQASGGNGGAIDLLKSPTGSTLVGNPRFQTFDNRVFVFESGGTNRGFNIDLSKCAAGVATSLLPVALAGAQGLSITNNGTTPNTKADITATQAILTTTAGVPFFWQAGGTKTIDLTLTGLNGLDTGAKAINTWYNVFLVSDGTNVGCLASLSATAPTLPANFIYFMRVGAMETDGAGNLYRTRQDGNKATYNGTLRTIPSSNTGVASNVSTYFPPTCRSYVVILQTSVNSISNLTDGINTVSVGTQITNSGAAEWPVELSNVAATFTVKDNNAANSFAYAWFDRVNAT